MLDFLEPLPLVLDRGIIFQIQIRFRVFDAVILQDLQDLGRDRRRYAAVRRG